MKRFALASFTLLLLSLSVAARAQDFPELPPPAKEHEWLKQFEGDWEQNTEIFIAPDQPSIKASGTETVRMLGGFWIVSEGSGDFGGQKFNSVLTLGFDPEKKKYVGTWVDSMSSMLWKYEGTVDETGKILTLETTGPCPKYPGKTAKFKEVTEFKDKDHRIFTSNVSVDDGPWEKMVVVESKRKK